MKNTKRTLILSCVVMALALVVTIVGISAAWFGDVRRVTTEENRLIISSNRPKGQATIDVESASSDIVGGDKLMPAVATPGWLLSGGDPDTLDVLVQNVGNGVDRAATQVYVYFPFTYVGAPDAAAKDGKKSVKLTLTSATLENPRRTDGDGNDDGSDIVGLTNYIDEFSSDLCVVKKVGDGASASYTEYTADEIAAMHTSASGIVWEQQNDGRALHMLMAPGIDFYLRVKINFARVDEECDPSLIDTTLFFNFDIEAVPRA